MRRADRLFRLIQTMRGGRLWTARRLAEAFEVSERTIYRDIADLQASGTPIDGAAGVGYVLRPDYDLPPLMFTSEEIVALALGARLTAAWGGHAMARGARDALSKIEAVLPRAGDAEAALARLSVPAPVMEDRTRSHVDALDAAVRDRRIVEIGYRSLEDAASERRVHPLGLFFWGAVWTVCGWCELRRDFRVFRLDRIERLRVSDERFEAAEERSLATFIARTTEREGRALPPDPLLG